MGCGLNENDGNSPQQNGQLQIVAETLECVGSFNSNCIDFLAQRSGYGRLTMAFFEYFQDIRLTKECNDLRESGEKSG